MISIVIPTHDMANKDFFLKRCLDSIEKQTFKDYEVLQIEQGSFAKNCNIGIRKAKGDLVKFLCMDDWLVKNSLQRIADTFKTGWLMTGCSNNPHPYWTDDIIKGNNKLGNPSCLTIENTPFNFIESPRIYFDESLKWMVDIDFYMKLFKRYGKPAILDEINVNIGLHPGQMSYLISDEIKLKEHQSFYEKYS